MAENPTEEGGMPPLMTPVEAHGTDAWVIISRDHPLASMVMSYPSAEKLHKDLGEILERKR